MSKKKVAPVAPLRFEVEWSPLFPDEVRSIAEPLLRKYAHLVSGWVYTLTMSYGPQPEEPDGSRIVAQVRADFEYRQVHVRLYPHFLTENAVNRERTFAHEFLHIPLAPLMAYAKGFVSDFTEPDTGDRAKYLRELADLEEGVVQDLTFSALPVHARG